MCGSASGLVAHSNLGGALRRAAQGISHGEKILIVLDHFEQWLHAGKGQENSELVQALRQCDGANVQCIVMVRDDFWMAATRFMKDLEFDLLPGHNTAAVDVFDVRHATKVLRAFGQALGTLPDDSKLLTKEEQRFLNRAVEGLGHEGKVISVRLALFAEMMKKCKPWTTSSRLNEAGGTTGVGVTFLEETFSSHSVRAPRPGCTRKPPASVLKALLPEVRDRHQGEHALPRRAPGGVGLRQSSPRVRGLAADSRRRTPADYSDGPGRRRGRRRIPDRDDRWPKILPAHTRLSRAVLARLADAQAESEARRGRAELRLAERAAIWNARPENRHLPSISEYSSIILLTSRSDWTEPQERMMNAARRGAWAPVEPRRLRAAGRRARGRSRRPQSCRSSPEKLANADVLIKQLLVAHIGEVPGIVARLEEDPHPDRPPPGSGGRRFPGATRMRNVFARHSRWRIGLGPARRD